MKKEELNLADAILAEQEKNKYVVIGVTLMNIILAISYFIEVVKGARSMASYLIVAVGCLFPTIIYLFIYFRKKESIGVRYITTIGFCILYGYIMLTTKESIAFCYILLIFTLLTIYGDLKLSYSCSIYSVLLNIVVVIKNIVTVGLTQQQITESEIIIACVLLASIFSIMATTITSKINQSRLSQSNAEKEQISDLLTTILASSESIIKNVQEVSNEMSTLESSISATKNSMEDLETGAKDTAQAIQTQQEKTEEIHSHINQVESVTKSISNDVTKAEDILKTGQQVMDDLLQQVKVSEVTSNQVVDEMEELKKYTDKMQDILSL
ncbi:MAG: hypothetical protein RSB37_01465, partial [Acetivibrio sp.]